MLRSLLNLEGYGLEAKDGRIGTLRNFLFEDNNWNIRYLVVDTGSIFPGPKVLVSPRKIKEIDWPKRSIELDMDIDEIKESPSLDSKKPVSKEMAEEFRKNTAWPVFWIPVSSRESFVEEAASNEPVHLEDQSIPNEESNIPHLRSLAEVAGYQIQAKDDTLGNIKDFIVEDGLNWEIKELVIYTRNWIPGKSVLVPASKVEKVLWREKKVYLDMTSEKIEGSKEYSSDEPVNSKHVKVYYDYLGRQVDPSMIKED